MRSGRRITSGRTATRKITFFDPEGFRSQIAAECDFDPLAAGLTEHDTRRMDRYIQFAAASAIEAIEDSGLQLDELDADRSQSGVQDQAVDRGRMAVTPGLGGGGHDGAGGRLRGRFQPRQGVAGRPRVRAALSLQRDRPEQPGQRGGAEVRRARPGGRHLHRLHVGHRRRGLRPPADPGRRGRRGDLGRRGVAASHRSRWPASTRSRPRRAATTTPSTRRGRSTAIATAS